MGRDVNIGNNNKIMKELGMSSLPLALSSLPRKKSTSKGGRPGSKGNRSCKNASQGEGSDLSYYIPEVEEPNDGDDDIDLEEEPTPLAIKVHLLS